MKTNQENLVDLLQTALHYAKQGDYKQTDKFIRFSLSELDKLMFVWEDIEDFYKRLKEKKNQELKTKLDHIKQTLS